MFKNILSLIKQSIFYGTGQILIKSVGILLIPIYTRVLTVADYGIIGTLAPLSAILMYLFNFGISGAVMRFDADMPNDEERKIAHGTAWLFLIVMALGISLLLALLSIFSWRHLFPAIPIYPFAFLIIASVAIRSTNIIPMALLRIRGNAMTFSVIQFAEFILLTSMIILLVVGLRLGAKGQFIAILFTSSVFAIIYIIIALRAIKINVNGHYLKKYLAFGLPLIPSGLSIWVISLSNHLILQRMTSLEQVGLFSLGYKFGLILDIIVVAIMTAWQPFFYNNAGTGNGKELFSQVATYFLFVVLGVGVTILLSAQEILHIATTPQFYDAGKVVGFVIVGIIFRAMYLFNVQGIAYSKKTKYLPFIDGAAATLNIILSLLLIPKYLMIGAAYSTMITYFFQLSCGFLVSKRLYPIPYQYKRMIKIVLMYIIAYIGLSSIGFNSDISTLVTRWILLPFVVVLVLLLFRVPEKRELRKVSELFQRIRLKNVHSTNG